MRIRVNELLTISRLPYALWTSIHGGKPHHDNPGSSVISFCHFVLTQEYVYAPIEIQESIQQCRDFSSKREHLEVLIQHLEVRGSMSLVKANSIAQPERVLNEVNDVNRYHQEVKRLLQSYEVNSEMPKRIDISSQHYPTFLQSLLDFNLAIEKLDTILSHLQPTQPPDKA